MDMFQHQFQSDKHFQLPKINLATNDHELKRLRQKLLMDYYEKQIQAKKQLQMKQKDRMGSRSTKNVHRSESMNKDYAYVQKNVLNEYHTKTPFLGYLNSNSNAYNDHHHLKSNSNPEDPLPKELEIRKYLAQDLQQQIKFRQNSKKNIKKAQLDLQKQQIDYMTKAFKKQQQYENQMKERFKRDLQSNYISSIQKKQRQKQLQRYDKQLQNRDMFNRLSYRKSQGNLHSYKPQGGSSKKSQLNFDGMYGSNESTANLQKRVNRSSTSADVNNYQFENYNNNSNVSPIYSQQRKRVNDEPEQTPQFFKNPQLHLFKHRNQYQAQLKSELKETLLQQMSQARERRKNTKKQYFQENKPQSFMSKHDPIVNPIDFKITNDNLYILKELQAQKTRQMENQRQNYGSPY